MNRQERNEIVKLGYHRHMLTDGSDLQKSVLQPDVWAGSASAEEQKKRQELYDKTQKEWAAQADTALEPIRTMMKAAADTLGITSVIDVYSKLQEFEYSLRGVSYRLADEALANKKA
jgi:hypothetical protein